MINFENKMDDIFEAIEDEENPDIYDIEDDSADEVDEKEDDMYGYEETDTRDWTNISNPKPGKSLADLKKTRKPLESGWTFEEVISALKPNLVYAARKYSTPNFSQDEALLSAMEAVMDAIRTDKGEAPFTSHVFQYIASKVKRAAAGTRDFPTANVSGIKPNVGGTTDFLKSARATMSADAPVGDEEGGGEQTYVSRLSGDAVSGSEIEKEQLKLKDLLFNLFTSEEVGLTDNESVVMLATYGINKDAEYLPTGPNSTKDIASAFGVSNVRVSQMRKKALDKIKLYFDSIGIESEEEALASFGLEEARKLLTAKMVIESMPSIIRIDMEQLNECINIPLEINIGGISRKVTAKVNSDSLTIDDVVTEGNESLYYKVDSSMLNDVRNEAVIRLSSKYYSDIVESVIGMYSKPVLGVLGVDLGDEEDEKENHNID